MEGEVTVDMEEDLVVEQLVLSKAPIVSATTANVNTDMLSVRDMVQVVDMVGI